MKQHANLSSVHNPLLVDGEGVVQPLRHWALSQFMNCIYIYNYIYMMINTVQLNPH